MQRVPTVRSLFGYKTFVPQKSFSSSSCFRNTGNCSSLFTSNNYDFGFKTNNFSKHLISGGNQFTMQFSLFHTSTLARSEFDLKDLPGMKPAELKKLSDKFGLDTDGLTKQEMIEQLSPFAKGAKINDAKPLDNYNKKFWLDVAKKARTIPLASGDTLSLSTFDACKDEAQMIAITKSIFKDFGVSDRDIIAEIELLQQLERDPPAEDMEEDDFTQYRRGLLEQIRKNLDTIPEGRLEEAITSYFDSPFESLEQPSIWMKPYCIELILTTLLDAKPGFDTTDNWDEDFFLEKVNSLIEEHHLRLSYDPEYDWEDTTGNTPLEVTLESTEGKVLGKTQYKFPDPEEFDQSDLMDPINQLLQPHDLKFLDASWFGEDVASYNWLLMPAAEATRLEQKYGSLADWYSEFPDREEELGEGEEEYEEGEMVEEEPPKKAQPAKKAEPAKKAPEPARKPEPVPVQKPQDKKKR